GLLLISGPLDFSACRNQTARKLLSDYLGDDPQAWMQADPIRHVRGDEGIPVLCIHGAKDPLVDVQNSFSFAGRVNGGGRSVAQVRVVDEGYHSDLVTLFIDRSATADYLVDWLKSLVWDQVR
ncbi:MAG: hypothetical protein JW850_19095, partial [Thermoflexales bacterium]|nr:hypothetical protein [Thermoflexales bacterium]